MILRNIKECDIEKIYKLYEMEGWKSFTLDLVKKFFSTSNWVIVEDNDEIIAFARYITDSVLTVFLCEIIVHKDHRRKGIGKMIIDEIFEQHKDLRIELISDEDEFYQKLGFRNVGNGYRRYQSE